MPTGTPSCEIGLRKRVAKVAIRSQASKSSTLTANMACVQMCRSMPMDLTAQTVAGNGCGSGDHKTWCELAGSASTRCARMLSQGVDESCLVVHGCRDSVPVWCWQPLGNGRAMEAMEQLTVCEDCEQTFYYAPRLHAGGCLGSREAVARQLDDVLHRRGVYVESWVDESMRKVGARRA